MSGEETALKSSQGAIWVQPDGPNTEPEYVGCVTMEVVTEPKGEVALVRCFAPSGEGWDVRTQTQAPPGNVTATLSSLMERTQNYLEKIADGICGVPLYALMRDGGRADVFTNYVRGSILRQMRVTSRTRSNMVHRDTDNPAELGFDIAALPPVIDVFELTVSRLSIAEPSEITGIAFERGAQCQTPSLMARKSGQIGYVGSKAPGGSPGNKADVWHTGNSGGVWTAGATEPFGAGIDIGAAVQFPTGRTTRRIIVARAETVGGSPAMVAYSDDDGDTWTLASVGAVNAQYIGGLKGLFALDIHHVWAVTDGGYIYFSGDGGATWAALDAGVMTAQNLNAVHFIDADVGWVGGATNALGKSLDGGVSWSAVSGPVAEAAAGVLSVFVIDQNNAWITYDSGKMYFTTDGGLTWTQRTFPGSGSGTTTDLQMADQLTGYMIHNTAAGPVGTVFHTINGGFDWEALTTPTNAGLNVLAVCGPNLAYASGKAQAGTGVILKVFNV